MGSSTTPLSTKIILISTCVLLAATAINFYFPLILNFILYDVPVICSSILSWLKPPYLYVVVNGIIITIVASSRLQHYHYNHYQRHDDLVLNEPISLQTEDSTMLIEYETQNMETEEDEAVMVYAIEPPVIDIGTVPVNDLDVVADEAEAKDKFVISKPIPVEKIQTDVSFPVRELPLVSSRFAHQRRLTRVNPEGVRSLRVSKPRKHETLENTWKMITDGRHIPLNRHLRKADTIENHHHHTPIPDTYNGEQVVDYTMMDKFETFNDRNDSQNQRMNSSRNSLPPSGGKLRKEGSLSHDELNRRVEAFIKKFNDEMRLQRQESLQRYMDMINRGT